MKATLFRVTCGLMIAALLAASAGCGVGKNSGGETTTIEPETALTTLPTEPEEPEILEEEEETELTETTETTTKQPTTAATTKKPEETKAPATTEKATDAPEVSESEEDTTVAADKSQSSTYKAAYKEFLLTYLDSGKSTTDDWFGFIYLDNDDIPELVISKGSFNYAKVELYAYINSQVKLIGNYGRFGTFQYEQKKGYILDANQTDGHFKNNWLEYKNGSAKVIWSQENDEGAQEEGAQITYKVNGKTVSKEVYDEEYKKTVKSHKLKETPFLGNDADAYMLTQSNIASCDQL